jgi:hypothetical protein
MYVEQRAHVGEMKTYDTDVRDMGSAKWVQAFLFYFFVMNVTEKNYIH